MPETEISDSELAALAGQGDSVAYGRLFERYQHPVYNFVYRLVDNAEDASDIVQNAFLKVFTVLEKNDIQNFSAYLYRTAKNLAYDEMRRRSRFADVDHEILAPEDPNIYADPQRALLLGEQLEAVRRAAGNLNQNQRAALILRELQELDYDQMSEVLESNRNAVGALLSRARLRLREELRMAQIRTEQMPATCEEIIALLSPYIDEELSEDQRQTVESHLTECTFCTAALAEMQEASRSFRMLIPVVPPTDMAQAFSGRLQDLATGKQTRISRLLRSRFMWTIAAVVAVFGLSALLLAENTGRDEAGPPGITGGNTTTEPAVRQNGSTVRQDGYGLTSTGNSTQPGEAATPSENTSTRPDTKTTGR